LFGNQAIRTGIDIGSTSVKLVRGSGKTRLEQITHVGIEPYVATSAAERVTVAAEALKILMSRLGLSKYKLGRLAVTVGWQDAMVQEAITPPLDAKELVQALPFESRKHMNLDGMIEPVLDGQILGVVTDDDAGGTALSRVLFAAVSKDARDYTLSILTGAGLEPMIIDLEPLAGLNELFSHLDTAEMDGKTIGLVDLGGRHAAMHIVGSDGSLLSRNLGPGSSRQDGDTEQELYTKRLAGKIQQTITYYRGKHRQQVNSLYAIGGGAYAPGRLESLSEAVNCPVTLLDPMGSLDKKVKGAVDIADRGAELVTACGLCRWGDD